MKKGYWNRVWMQFMDNRLSIAGLIIVILLFGVAAGADLIANGKPFVYRAAGKTYFPILHTAKELRDVDFRRESRESRAFALFAPIPFSPSEYDLNERLLPPSGKHWLGTDEQGRDLASRMIHGTRVSMIVGLIAVFLYVSIGVVVGAAAGYYGGVVDMLISRFIEIMMCFPTFFLILTILALWGAGLFGVMVVIGITRWTGIARIVRGEFLKLKELDYVTASRALGARDWWIIFRHILPNALAPVLVSATFGIASTIIIESSLSFLGFGVQPPTPSWGEILSQSRKYIDFAWWLTIFPGIAIFTTITAYNLVGQGLQDALDPKSVLKK